MKIYTAVTKILGHPWDVVMFHDQTVDESCEVLQMAPQNHVLIDSGETTILAWPKASGVAFWGAFAARTQRTVGRWYSEDQPEVGIAVEALARVPAMWRKFEDCLRSRRYDPFRADFQGDFYDFTGAFEDARRARAARAKERASWGTGWDPFAKKPQTPPFPGKAPPPFDWSKVNFNAPPAAPAAPPDAYSVLGLSPGASREDVLAAHKRLAKENHPDRGGDGQRLAKINVARDEILGTGVAAPRRRAGF